MSILERDSSVVGQSSGARHAPLDMQRGGDYTLTTLSLGVHAGTQMDAPIHVC